MPDRVDALLVCGGRFHDFDHARLELLRHLAAHPEVRTQVRPDYADLDALARARFLVTYTCDVRPDEAQQDALASWVEAGGRWLALHGTNALLDIQGMQVETPRLAPRLMETLGSQFLAHPPIAPYKVEVSAPEHPLVRGIEPFEASDELYLCEYHAEVETLLHTSFSGATPGFGDGQWNDPGPHPVMYLRRLGEGQVLYLTLGHCRGHWDMQPVVDYYPQVERGSWDVPAFHELLRRGLGWALERP